MSKEISLRHSWQRAVHFLGSISFSVGMAIVSDPGDYITHWILPPGSVGASYDLGLVIFIHIATDSFCCFVGLLGIYLLLCKRVEKSQIALRVRRVSSGAEPDPLSCRCLPYYETGCPTLRGVRTWAREVDTMTSAHLFKLFSVSAIETVGAPSFRVFLRKGGRQEPQLL